MPATLLSSWKTTVRAGPALPALIDAASGRVWTRTEIDARARAWSQQHGAGVAGRVIAFAETNGPAWLEVFLGTLYSGAAAAALDPGDPSAARDAAAASARAAFVWSEGRLHALPGRRRRAARRACLVKLTSGSTGKPRGLAFTDSEMLGDCLAICAGMGIRPRDRNLAVIPFGHSYGLGNLVVPLLAQGSAVVCCDPALPQAVAAAAEQWKPTVFPAVPALLAAMAETSVRPKQLRSLRTVISAGAPLDAGTAREFDRRFGLKVHSFYGSTETGGITYDRTGDAALSGRSVGAPLPRVRLFFEARGRFSVAGPAVYTIGNPRRQGRRGLHRPADLAVLDARGEVVLRGRTGRMVKIAGRRLDLAEVERALRRLPGVTDAFAAPHPVRPGALAAAIAVASAIAGSVHPDSASIRSALREHLASWKIPRRIVVLARFPLTPRGKPDTRALAAALSAPVHS